MALAKHITQLSDRSEEWPCGLVGALALGAVVLATLAFGAVDRADRAAWTTTLCALGCIACGTMLVRGHSVRIVPGTLPLALFVGLVFLQAAPITTATSAEIAAVTGLAQSSALSLVPAATLSRSREALALLVLFIVGIAAFRGPQRLRQLPWATLLVGSVLAVYFSLNPFLEHVPAHHVDVDASRHVFGTYLSRNHVGSFFAFATVLGIGLLSQRAKTLNHQAPVFLRRQVAIAVMMCANIAGLLLTESRGALLGLLAGAAVFGSIGFWRSKRTRRLGTAVVSLIILGGLAVAMPTGMRARFSTIAHDLTNPASRSGIWSGATELFSLAPVTGIGFGTYPHASVLTQPAALPGHVEHAHCDLLELLVETGLLGGNLLLWGLGLVILAVLRRAIKVRGDRRTLLAVGAVAAAVAVLVQSAVDFPFHIPALAAWVCLLLGAAAGAMATAHGVVAAGWMAPRWVLAVALVTLGTAATYSGQEAWAYRQLQKISARGHATQRIDALNRLAAIHSLRGEGLSRAAALSLRSEDAPPDLPRVVSLATAALAHNPLDGRAQRVLAAAAMQSPQADPLVVLEQAVRLVPPDDRENLRIDLGMALLAGNRQALAGPWFRQLFQDPSIDPVRVLQRLHRDGSPDLDLTPLIPPGTESALRTVAGQLLAAGALKARERFLDLLLGRLPNAQRRTLRDAVVLTEAQVEESSTASGRTLQVSFLLEAPGSYRFDGHMMRLSLLGPRGVAELPFAPRLGPCQHVFPVPAHLPPGRYDLAVQPFTKGARFPLRFFDWPESSLHLTPGQQLQASTALYCELDPPQLVPADGLPLNGRNRIWRRVRLSSPGGLLVLTCADTTQVQCTVDGQPLQATEHHLTTTRSFRLPDDRLEFLLELRTAAPATTTIQELTLLTGRRAR